jgi:hypothetical protein
MMSLDGKESEGRAEVDIKIPPFLEAVGLVVFVVDGSRLVCY